MHAWLARRFALEMRARLPGAAVRRVVPVADGLLLVLQTSGGDSELGIGLVPGAAWCWWLGGGARAALLAEVATVAPDLATLDPELGWRGRDATPLDAMRAWLVRPAPLHPGWARLDTARLASIEPRGGDRVLRLEFETEDLLGSRARLQLLVELFDRGGNAILSDAAGIEIANWRGHSAAPAREHDSEVDPHGALHWDAMRGIWLDTAADGGGLGLAAAAHLAISTPLAIELASRERRSLRRESARLTRLLEKLDADADGAAEAESWRAQGELLAANQHRVRRGQSRITVEDWFAAGAPRDLELDPNLSAQENVALFFKRARRGSRGRDTIAARRTETRSALEAARAALEAFPAEPDWSAALHAAANAWRAACPQAVSTPPAALWSPGGPGWRGAGAPARGVAAPGSQPEKPARAAGPGRRFVLDGTWEVWVGRSNAENDTLTHRFAHPEDVWLHASGVPGSHVVLRMQGRSDNPPRDVLEAAAAIAARFSKAKHAGTVPVIWTRKRYVRKPRGAKPGLATCTHEKTVFVRPGLPAGSESD